MPSNTMESNQAGSTKENESIIEPTDYELTVTTRKLKDKVKVVLTSYAEWLDEENKKPKPDICYNIELISECKKILANEKRLKPLRKELENFISRKLIPKRGFIEKFYMYFDKQSNKPYDLCLHLTNLMKEEKFKYSTIIKDQELKEARRRLLESGLSFTQTEYNEMRDRLNRNYQFQTQELRQKINRLEEEKAKLEVAYRQMKERAERAESNNNTFTTRLTTAEKEIVELKKQIEYLKSAQHKNTFHGPDRKFQSTNNSSTPSASSKMPGAKVS
jgi:chromosome segregation ATPase